MKEKSKFHNLLRWIPRIIGYGAMLALTWFWAFWSFGEMYHEGWWGPWYNRILYLIPAGIALVLTLLVVYFPKIGPWITIGFGVAATVFFWGDDLFSRTFEWQQLGGLLIIGGGFFLFGALFLNEARYRKKRQAAGWIPASQW